MTTTLPLHPTPTAPPPMTHPCLVGTGQPTDTGPVHRTDAAPGGTQLAPPRRTKVALIEDQQTLAEIRVALPGLELLLGFELGREQFERGERFVAGVVERGGEAERIRPRTVIVGMLLGEHALLAMCDQRIENAGAREQLPRVLLHPQPRAHLQRERQEHMAGPRQRAQVEVVPEVAVRQVLSALRLEHVLVSPRALSTWEEREASKACASRADGASPRRTRRRTADR